MYRHIVHANDGHANSMKALEAALQVAELCGAKLDILVMEEIHPQSGSVYEVRREKAVADRAVEQLRRKIVKIADRHPVPFQFHVFTGPPVALITEFVHESEADLLVIGASEHVSMIELVLGRRSDRIVHHSKCSVLIVR